MKKFEYLLVLVEDNLFSASCLFHVETMMRDEDYSKLFKSLKHDTRRSVLIMLYEKDRSFTELFETLEITSSHLGYHLQVLGSLIVKNGQKYALSTRGKETVNWIKNIESPPGKPKTSFFYEYLSIILLILVPTLMSNIGETFHVNFNSMMSGLILTCGLLLILMYPIVLVAFTSEYAMAPSLYTGFNHFFSARGTNAN